MTEKTDANTDFNKAAPNNREDIYIMEASPDGVSLAPGNYQFVTRDTEGAEFTKGQCMPYGEGNRLLENERLTNLGPGIRGTDLTTRVEPCTP